MTCHAPESVAHECDSAKFPGEGLLLEILVGVYRLVLQILALFQTKKCHFPPPFFSDQTCKIHTCF